MQQLCLDFMGKLCGAWLSRQRERDKERERKREGKEKRQLDREREPRRVSRKSAKLGWANDSIFR